MLNICEQPIMGNNKNTILLQIDVEYSVQSGNKKFDRMYKVATLRYGYILQFVIYNLATERKASQKEIGTIWQQKILTEIQSGNITRWQHFLEA